MTVEDSSLPALLVLVRRLRDLGAFVVYAGIAAGGYHLHHFPLQAATIPRASRLVCTDLADHLVCWAPGDFAHLHVIPSAYDTAMGVLSHMGCREHAEGRGVRAVNLHLHLDADAPGSSLVEIDRLAASCEGFLLAPD